jgi:ATP-dependent Clp protease protease subunit
MHETSTLVPIIIESTNYGERSYDIWSRLMRDRILFLGSEIDDHVANIVVAQLLFLASENDEKDINIYINSPGGSVSAGLAIYDTMQLVKCPIVTTCVGMAASMAAVLLCAGSRGKRFMLPNSRVMIHQPMGGAYGQASDVEIAAREIGFLKSKLAQIVSKHTGKHHDIVLADSDRDRYMSADEAVAYGIADRIVSGGK